MKTIHLLRHFETDAAESDIYCSRTDVSLNKEGKRNAQK